jgi:hypothetical protein
MILDLYVLMAGCRTVLLAIGCKDFITESSSSLAGRIAE